MGERDGDAMSIARLRSNEVGATAVLVAASMVLLMGMAALVVDYGLGLSERRLDQNVADAAVMGGAIVTIQTADMDNGVTEIKRLVDANLGRTVDNTAWQACVDADQLAYTPDPGNECISWETGDDTVVFRVRVPKQDTETTFGKVLGVDTLTTDAFAEATLEVSPDGKILPFGLFASNASGTEACLKDTSGPALPPPCDGPSIGQFGPFEVYKYAPGPSFCASTSNVFRYSVGLGIDHPMSSYEPDYVLGNPEARENCTAGVPVPVPDTVQGGTGNKVTEIGDGLVSGATVFGGTLTFPGRLAQAGSTATIGLNGPGPGVGINNQPIWDWFIPGNTCHIAAAAAVGIPAKKLASLACIEAWSATNGAIFNNGFINAQRLAFVPNYAESTPAPGGFYHINQFLPVYLESLYIQSSGTFVVHSPGEEGNFSGSQLKGLTAIVLDCGMLVDQPCDPETTSGDPFAADLSTLLLSR